MSKAQTANEQDCTKSPCPGKAAEACGGTDRILVYQDINWAVIERPDLGTQVQKYSTSLAELVNQLKQWKEMLQRYEQLNGKRGVRVRRDETEIQRQFRELKEYYASILKGVQTYGSSAMFTARIHEV